MQFSAASNWLTTNSKDRDEDLKSEDIFDVGRYPNILFAGIEFIRGAVKLVNLISSIEITSAGKLITGAEVTITFNCQFVKDVQY